MSTFTFVVVTGITVIVLWIAWDIYAIWTQKRTITDVIRSWGAPAAVLIGLVMGLLIGHFWL